MCLDTVAEFLKKNNLKLCVSFLKSGLLKYFNYSYSLSAYMLRKKLKIYCM